jgi:hypothetical protein
MRTPVALDDVEPAGDLRRRAELNLRRLHDAEFQFDAMMSAFTAREAPGDWVGRCLLALVQHARLLGHEASHLREIVERLPLAFNARGYLGEVQPPGTADENRLGGHNALLRALCEYHRWRPDERVLGMLRSVITGLMLPTLALWAEYPDEPDPGLRDNRLVGLTMRRTTGSWRGLSTDIGVGFFVLDGLTQAYVVDPSPELRELVETVLARYVRFDPVAHSAQTHSTLSTLRGILRWWREVDPRPELLGLVLDRWRLYRGQAETEHHANYNWFGRPDWTEPCAIVDAFLLAVQLWSATGDADHLEEAHRIYHNALRHAQRPNGGFGCDLCTGARGLIAAAPHEFFEAPWCCTMRGAEGLARAAQFGWFTGPEEIVLPFYFGGTARLEFPDGAVRLAQETGYPEDGYVRLRVLDCTLARRKTVRFFAPSWSPPTSFRITHDGVPVAVTPEAGFAVVELSLRAGDEIAAEFPLERTKTALQNPARQPGHHRYAHGPLLLGVAEDGADASGDSAEAGARSKRDSSGEPVFVPLGRARYRIAASGDVLAPLPALVDVSEEKARAARTRIVFAD